jgi:hypothetical protein
MAQPPRREKICCAGVRHDAQCVSAATDCVAKQDPGRQKLNNETIAFFRDAWDVFVSH